MSRTSTKESIPSDNASSSIKSSAASVELKDAVTNTSCTIAIQSSDKHSAASDSKNPSVVKIAPFSHHPSSNKCKPKTSYSLPISAHSNQDTSAPIKSEDQTTLDCGQLSAISSSQNYHEDDRVVTVFVQKENSNICPIPVAGVAKAICSCQLRQHVTKYGDKGKSNDDPIVIDSDEEEEKSDAQGKPVNISDNSQGRLIDLIAGLQSPILMEYGQPLFVWLSRDRAYVRVYRLYG